ncbi:MAG: DNA polymerase I [Hahellaceae bacterium]|nr:DNA polymerase I [Hahellaceae bacterium]MCP5168428.1 DNA polymerase I [Hahellaceae bacterium]
MNQPASSAPVILVDGSSYLFRAFHALPPLTTSKGMPTGAIKGVLNMLRKLQQDFPQSRIIVVFDAKGKNFRHDLFPEYKANRPPMPEDLRVQIEPLLEIIRAMGLPLLIESDVEADDVIGTLAHQATTHGIATIISTGDKDMAQLVSEHVTLINTMSDTTMDIAGVKEKFGVAPEQIIDYLALMGDTVDNIPGIPKCGPKTAVKWLEQYGSMNNLIANAHEIGGKIGENLRNSIPHLPLSYQLATIKTDVALSHALDEIMPGPPDTERLRDYFTEFEFRSWIRELNTNGKTPLHSAQTVTSDTHVTPSAEATDQSSKTPAPIDRSGYETLLTQADLDRWLELLRQSPWFAFDTETTSLDYMQARIVGVSFATAPGKAAYLPLGHDYMGAPEQLDRDSVLLQLKPLLEDPAIHKVGQNFKYDMNVLANHGIHLQGIHADTMLESYVLNSVGSRHDMDTLAQKYLDHETVHFEDIAGKGAKQLTFNQIEVAIAAEYAAEDADVTYRLHECLTEALTQTPRLKEVFENIELPLVPVLARIERQGALVDKQRLQKQSIELAERLQELEREAFVIAGTEFNLASPKQLQEIFYNKLNLPVLKKTPTGVPSTAEPVLQDLAAQGHELPKVLLEHRSLSKLKSTYTDKLPLQINPVTGRIHTSYHQAVTATGRLSSSDPNLQNIPIRTAEGRRIRQAFVAPSGYKLLAADYSQIELRIMAHLSNDTGLMNAFAHGDDVHKATAAEVFGVALDEVSLDQRRSAKAINFGLIYGMSAFGLANQINVDRGTAQSYIKRYFERYPGVQQYMDNIREQAHRDGYVETLFGRRLYLPEINARNKMNQQAAERTAINAPMQGTAADIIKRAMIDVQSWLDASTFDARIILQVHDELVLEVKEDQIDQVRKELVSRMENAVQLNVPLLVETGVGNNWDEAH